MNKRNKLTKSIINLILFLSILMLSMGLICFNSDKFFVKAQQKSYSNILPTSMVENIKLNNPIDAIITDNEIIILEQNSVIICDLNGIRRNNNFTQLRQIKDFNDESFLVSDNGTLYLVDKQDFTKTPLTYQSDIVGGSYFDHNDEYLITIYESKIIIYELDRQLKIIPATSSTPEQSYMTNVGIKGKSSTSINASGNHPISINGNNEIFYVYNNVLWKSNVSFLSNEPSQISADQPFRLLSTEEYVYYIFNNKVFKVSTVNGAPEELIITNADNNYDLGNLRSPYSINFKGENLFIADNSLNAVQEFKISGDRLTFTGFAIAQDKTAYNRISASAKDIEKIEIKNGKNEIEKYIAVLDDKKVTLISNYTDTSTRLATFNNILITDIRNSNNDEPVAFALGNKTILFGYTNTVLGNNVMMYNFADNEFFPDDSSTDETPVKKEVIINGAIKDVCYNNGLYYVLSDDGNNTLISTISEKDFSIVSTLQKENIHATQICVDMSNNIYIADSTNIYVNNKTYVCAGAKKIMTDLAGVLYFTDGNYLYSLTGLNDTFERIDFLGDVKTFCMSFDNKEIFFIKNETENDSGEIIYRTTDCDNYSINSTGVPAEYVLNGSNADFEDLKLFTLKEGSNVYSITSEQNHFVFNGFADIESEYVYICDVEICEKLTLCALTGQNGIVLVDKNMLEEKILSTSIAPQKAYVSTGVHLYYLPVITQEKTFNLYDFGYVRLEKNMEISPLFLITVFDKEMYYASAVVDGDTYYGYLPKNSTIETLSQNVEYLNYEFVKIKACNVYGEKELINVVFVISNETSIKLVKTENGISEIYYDSGEGWQKGFTDSTNLIIKKDNTLRSTILIITAVTCVTVTSLYFILRKKK